MRQSYETCDKLFIRLLSFFVYRRILYLSHCRFSELQIMSHDHHHSHTIQNINTAFIVGIVLNLGFVFVEAGFGFAYRSLALLSDAGHNLSDVASLVLALFAFRLARIHPTNRYTYGYKKSTILVSLFNALILLVAVGIIFTESIEKLYRPQPIDGDAIAWVAATGVLVNAVTAWLFYRHQAKDLNIRGAFLHMAADALVSIGVLASGIVIHHTGWYVIDPVIGLVVAVVILFSTWELLRDSVRLSLDGVPKGIDVTELVGIMQSVSGVQEVHHVHVWAISTTQNALTAHVVVASFRDMEKVKSSIKDSLRHHGIQHATLEFELPEEECNRCCDSEE